MKRVIAIALMAIFSTVMFAQTKTETKPATQTTQSTHKKKAHSKDAKAPATEVKAPATQPATAQPAGKKAETTAPAKKTETATPAKK
jgi:hypothetical protein